MKLSPSIMPNLACAPDFLFLSLFIRYFLPFTRNVNVTLIFSVLFLMSCSIFFPECCLNSAKLTASSMLDFPAPFSPITMDIPVLRSTLVFLWDLKFSILTFSIIIKSLVEFFCHLFSTFHITFRHFFHEVHCKFRYFFVLKIFKTFCKHLFNIKGILSHFKESSIT
ncbi:hypothetical protein DSECCO2_326170 [anaerobic digester metagenome]